MSKATAQTHPGPKQPAPIALHETATSAVRRHMVRDIRRVATLLAADVTTLMVLRVLLRATRDGGVFGSRVAIGLAHLIPAGMLPTAQFLLANVMALTVLGTYRAGDRRRGGDRLVLASFIAVTPLFWNTLWTSFAWPVLGAYFVCAGGAAAAFVVERSVVDWGVRLVRRSTGNRQQTLVVGPAEAARSTARYGSVKRELGLTVAGFIDVNDPPASDALGGIDGLVDAINHNRIETIIISGEVEPDRFRTVFEIGASAGCRILSVPASTAAGMIVPELISSRGVPLIQLTNPALTGQQLVVKRLVDVFAAALGLVFVFPVCLVIGVLIKLESAGPVLFRQTRVGMGGREFRIFKFRSMDLNAEDRKADLFDLSEYRDRRLFKVKNDPRVTRLGRFLRRSSLDELPQLINVLRGEMSLVGPRPPLPQEVALYEEHHYARFAMKPGITGPWQVGGRNRITEFDEVLLVEQGYMRQWNIFKDIAILFRTIPAVLRVDEAY